MTIYRGTTVHHLGMLELFYQEGWVEVGWLPVRYWELEPPHRESDGLNDLGPPYLIDAMIMMDIEDLHTIMARGRS
jgi:hypothetical protein